MLLVFGQGDHEEGVILLTEDMGPNGRPAVGRTIQQIRKYEMDGNTNGVDPAEIVKNELKNAPITLLSPQDFIEGKDWRSK